MAKKLDSSVELAAQKTREISANSGNYMAFLTTAAHKAIDETPVRLPKPFKVGLIGGLGPAATVDLYDKIVKATPAKNDQEHFKLVVEQNPQISDRTACLLKGGADPTLAMYGCARRLQKDGCDANIVPCTPTHAILP